MKLNEIRDNLGARKERMRVGRGEGSGKGKTCGSGHKGQKARTGVSINGFEGGQNPLYRRLPKRGFSNVLFATSIEAVSLKQIQFLLAGKTIDASQTLSVETFRSLGLIHKTTKMVKLIGNDVLTESITIEVHRASEGAKAALENAKGTLRLLTA